MGTRLTIWTDLHLEGRAGELLTRGVENHTLVRDGDALLTADAAYGHPDVATVLRSEKLRWVHVSSAGYTPFDRPEVWASLKQHGVAFTNSSTVFEESCAEQLLAMMLGLNRQLPVCVERQRNTRAWRDEPLRAGMRQLLGQSAILYGYGAIGRRLAQMLGPFEMEIVGVRRGGQTQANAESRISVVTPAEADGMLARFDHVVNILPASDQTRGFFGQERFERMKRGAYFYNIGRGTTVVQADLAEALASGPLGAAYLDVTTPEPLPSDDPLWTAKNCWITPHLGGGFEGAREKNVAHFLDNLRRFERGEELRDRVV